MALTTTKWSYCLRNGHNYCVACYKVALRRIGITSLPACMPVCPSVRLSQNLSSESTCTISGMISTKITLKDFSNETLLKSVFHKNSSRYLTYILPEPVWLHFTNIFNEIIHPWRIIGSARSICINRFWRNLSILFYLW